MSEAETLARAFHKHYERLAPDFGYETRRDSAVPWEDVPEGNRRLMVATAEALISEGWTRGEEIEFDSMAEYGALMRAIERINKNNEEVVDKRK